jgi:hypothetical protein
VDRGKPDKNALPRRCAAPWNAHMCERDCSYVLLAVVVSQRVEGGGGGCCSFVSGRVLRRSLLVILVISLRSHRGHLSQGGAGCEFNVALAYLLSKC